MELRMMVGMAMCLCAFAPLARADFSLRQAKAPDDTPWTKPAIFSYTRSDGGDTSYMTRGTAAYDFNWSARPPMFSNIASGARFTWAKNTLPDQRQDTREFAFETSAEISGEPQNYVLMSASVGTERNALKSANATTASIDISAGHDLLTSAMSLRPFAFIVTPTGGVFEKRIRDAPADATTGIAPTGTIRGQYAGASITLIPNFLDAFGSRNEFLRAGRWRITASTQTERLNRVVEGYDKGTFRLHSVALTYKFVDPPLTRAEKKAAPKLVPGIALRRQVGSDPWNEVPRGGFTQLVFSVMY